MERKETKNTSIQTFIGNITETTELQEDSIDLVYLSTVFHIFSAAQIVSFEKELRQKLSFSSGVLIDVGEHFYMQMFFKT